MTERCDPKTHRFGMAYFNHIGKVVYPEADYDGPYTPLEIINAHKLVRASEHDLIPMSDVQGLIDALKPLAKVWEVSGIKNISDVNKMGIWSCSDNRKEGNTSHTLTLGDCKAAHDLITAFNLKHKGD